MRCPRNEVGQRPVNLVDRHLRGFVGGQLMQKTLRAASLWQQRQRSLLFLSFWHVFFRHTEQSVVLHRESRLLYQRRSSPPSEPIGAVRAGMQDVEQKRHAAASHGRTGSASNSRISSIDHTARRLPVELFACDGNLLGFSLDKPEAIVDIWRLLGISRLSLDPTGPNQWQFADGYGTVGQLQLAYRERKQTGGMLVFHGKGAYTGPLSPKNLTGGCVLMVRYREAEPTIDGRLRQAIQVDAFLDMDGIGLEIVTRTLQPLIARSAAANLHEICLFMASLSDAAIANPEGVARLANRLKRTVPIDRQR